MGLGSPIKSLSIRDMVSQEKPWILFLQETKIEEKEVIHVAKPFKKDNNGITQDSKGA